VPAHAITFRADTFALVDASLLPEDLVEDLALAGAIVLATTTPGTAHVLTNPSGRVVGVERVQAAPLAPVVSLEDRRRLRVHDKVRGALAGFVAFLPLAAVLPPLVRL
jgi:hypothetical protein